MFVHLSEASMITSEVSRWAVKHMWMQWRWVNIVDGIHQCHLSAVHDTCICLV